MPADTATAATAGLITFAARDEAAFVSPAMHRDVTTSTVIHNVPMIVADIIVLFHCQTLSSSESDGTHLKSGTNILCPARGSSIGTAPSLSCPRPRPLSLSKAPRSRAPPPRRLHGPRPEPEPEQDPSAECPRPARAAQTTDNRQLDNWRVDWTAIYLAAVPPQRYIRFHFHFQVRRQTPPDAVFLVSYFCRQAALHQRCLNLVLAQAQTVSSRELLGMDSLGYLFSRAS